MNELSGITVGYPKSTLISIVPFPISEFKPGLIPGQFDLPACTDGRPVCKIISNCIHYVFIDGDRGSLRVEDLSYAVANSIVHDYNTAQLAVTPYSHPGFFWLPGELTTEKVETQYPEKLAEIRLIQRNWFVELVKMADDDWEKTRQHSIISDTQRYAARDIDPKNTKNRPWVIPQAPEVKIEMSTCPACGSEVPVGVAICRHCRFVLDEKLYSQMRFSGAQDIASQAIRGLK